MKALACALVLAASSGVAAEEGADMLEMEFRLIHGMGPGDAGGGKGASMLIDVARTGERWDRVWAIDSENRFLKFFTGCVTKAEVSPDRVVLDMLLRMGGGCAGPRRHETPARRGADRHVCRHVAGGDGPRRGGRPGQAVATAAAGRLRAREARRAAANPAAQVRPARAEGQARHAAGPRAVREDGR